MSLAGQVCLVTGASRGIGLAIGLELGKRGATVVGTATAEEGASRFGEALAAAGGTGRGAVLDVGSSTSVDELVKSVTADHGAVTVLVNNAGITRDNLLLRMSEAQWDETIDVDLKSVYRVTRACLRGMMKARAGRVINITSVVAATGNPGQTNYAAAKAGIIGFTKSLAAELAGRNITVNAVAPGMIDTDMTRALSDGQRDALLERIPLGRLGDPEDIAQAVAFLASPGAGYITGVTLHVNGGMFMG